MKNISSKILILFILIALGLGLSGCTKNKYQINDPVTNYKVLWKTLDEHYCYFTFKHINWDSLYPIYLQRAQNCKTDDELFSCLSDLLGQLKDGHVNLTSEFNRSRYWNWFQDYPRNFNQELIEDHYLGRDYRISGGLEYTRIGSQREIGYIRYPSFEGDFTATGLNQVFQYLDSCQGLIIDVRQNGGGVVSYAEQLAARFITEKVQYGYLCHKIGKGHDDFSPLMPVYLSPSTDSLWTKNVVILTNRLCFSSTNDFINMMKHAPKAKIMGDKTGGGGGLPMGGELPNSWQFRYSNVPLFDINKQNTEFGIEPDVYLSLDSTQVTQGKDSMIEYAINYLNTTPN